MAYFWDGLDRIYIGRQRTEKPGIAETAFFLRFSVCVSSPVKLLIVV